MHLSVRWRSMILLTVYNQTRTTREQTQIILAIFFNGDVAVSKSQRNHLQYPTLRKSTSGLVASQKWFLVNEIVDDFEMTMINFVRDGWNGWFHLAQCFVFDVSKATGPWSPWIMSGLEPLHCFQLTACGQGHFQIVEFLFRSTQLKWILRWKFSFRWRQTVRLKNNFELCHVPGAFAGLLNGALPI